MTLEFEIPLVSLIFLLMLAGVYFFKPSIKLVENKYYSMIIIFSIIEVVYSVIIHLMCAFNDFETLNTVYYPFINFANKIVTTVFVMIFAYLLAYTLTISYKKVRDNIKILNYALLALVLVVFTSMFFTKIEIIPQELVTNVGGSTPMLGYAIIAVILAALFVIAIINIKKYDKRYFPIYFIIPLMIILYLLTYYFPQMILYDFVLAILCYSMFFTIANPDMKLISELNIAKDQAVKANNAKTDFLSSMSHEIRTPLNAIVGFSQILNEYDDMPQNAKNEVNLILGASDNLLEIVNGILDISKIEANKLEIVSSEYEFQKMFNDLVAMCEVKLKNKDKPIEFKYSYDPSIPKVLYGDHGRVKQILLNLLTNSIKYTNEGFIDFKVNCVRKGGMIRLIMSVEDSGIGIQKDKIDKLFHKFERLEVEKNTTAEGTGLGLAITKKLVELMNGKIVVQSEYGEGSKFTVSIDQKIVEGKEKLEETQSISLPLEKADYSEKKVLVVDDNIINIKVASRFLQKYGIVAEEVSSGQECLDKLNEGKKYDLILLDDMMPKMTGTEVLKIIKEDDNFKTPIIALTANAISGMKEKYLSLGFTDYIPKPINAKELENKLKKYLGSKGEEK